MIRTFETHKIRKVTELSACLWDFSTLPKEGEGTALRVVVPSCWENYPDTCTYRGEACYERYFTASGNIRLEFKGVGHTANIFVDGEKVAHHYNAYTPFSAIIKDLPEGDHHLKVYVDNTYSEASALHVPNDYQSYGGISRPVVLEELSDVYISYIHVTPYSSQGVWHADIEVELVNLSDKQFAGDVTLYLDEEAFITVPVNMKGNETLKKKLEKISFDEVKSWSSETPVLYEISAQVKDTEDKCIDDLIERIGFREIAMEGKNILLNGKKIRIKGFCRHEDHPQFGCALPFVAMQQDLLLMKDMGANSVRTSHYPNDEIFLDLCDELGILVWEEGHARGLSEENMRNPNFERQSEDCIREMIMNHYNHPSIYIWGILNECASHTEYGRSCYKAQYDLIKALDASRPRSSASCQFKTDICFDLPEVVSYNIYPLWYHDTPPDEYLADLYNWVQEETGGKEKPFLVTEVGAGAIYGYRTPTKVKWSEEYQAEALEKQLTAVFSQEGCSGVYIWQFCDGKVCDSWFGGRPKTMNNKGIVDEFRRPKMAYEVVKRIFKSQSNYIK